MSRGLLLGLLLPALACGQITPTPQRVLANLPFTHREYSIYDYGAACNGTADDGPAIQAAANAAITAGGGVVTGWGTCAVATAVSITAPRVVFSSKHFGDQEHDIGGNDNGWVWKWTGTAGGTMLTFAPILSVSNPALTGDGAQGITFDCQNSAAIGLEIKSVKAGAWESLYFVECTIAGLDTIPVGNNGTLGEHPDVQGNRFHGIHSNIQLSTGSGVRLRGSADGSANTSFDTFYSCQFGYKNGDGILMLDTDNVGFYDVQMFRFGGGTGLGVELSGSSAASTRSAFFYDLSPGPGGITIRGTETNPNAVKNVQLIGYDITNGPPQPVLGTGVTGITIYKENGHAAGFGLVGGGGGGSADPPGAVFGGTEAEIVTAFGRLPNTTYSQYIYNGSSDGTWYDDGTGKWQLAQDGSHDFQILRQVGSGKFIVSSPTLIKGQLMSGSGTQYSVASGTGACATSSNVVGGVQAGNFKCTGSTGASTATLTLASSVVGWTCWGRDITTPTVVTQTGIASTTSITLNFTSVTSNDTVEFGCLGY